MLLEWGSRIFWRVAAFERLKRNNRTHTLDPLMNNLETQMTTSSDSKKCQSHPARTCNAMNALLLSLYLFFVDLSDNTLATALPGLRGFHVEDPKTVDDDHVR